jgi:hypothetical protein
VLETFTSDECASWGWSSLDIFQPKLILTDALENYRGRIASFCLAIDDSSSPADEKEHKMAMEEEEMENGAKDENMLGRHRAAKGFPAFPAKPPPLRIQQESSETGIVIFCQ